MSRARLTILAATALLALAASLVLSGVAFISPAAAQPPAGIVRPDSEPNKPTLELGSELFAANCSTCHGIAGRGITHARPGAGDLYGLGPPLRHVGARAADFYLRTGLMPLDNPHHEPSNDRVLFSGNEIRSLDRYVASLGGGPGIPDPHPRRGNISAGTQLFTEDCAGCHQEDARGGYVTGARVPPLQGYTDAEIAEAVRIGPYLMPKFSSRQISNAQLNSIIRYVQSQNHPYNRGGWGIGNIGPIPEGLVTWLIAAPLLLITCLIVGRRLKR
ncbi:MAG TPA: c-type cytochrome [Solirubrobacteraceae bacterium]|nr:c-type cytochrome [Solirubrobacteraceae bacterium]